MIYKDMIKVNEPKSSMTEVYRVLRNNIEFAYNNSNVKSVLITSTKNGEGKTTVAANLAVTMANSGKKTLLIDCNLNSPSLHKVFKTVNNVGLTTVIKNDKYSGQAAIRTNYDNLYLLTSGQNSERCSELLMGKRISDFLKQAKEKYDFIIIDTPAVMEKSDAQIISQYVDGCLLVIGSGEVNKEEARKTKELLEKVNAKILGAVLNKTEDINKFGRDIGEDENVIGTEVEKVKEFKEKFRVSNLKGGVNLRRKGVFARFFTMMLAVMMLLTVQPGAIIAKASNLTAEVKTENQGFFYDSHMNGDISIELSGNKDKVSVRVKYNSSYKDMSSAIQIWGSYGSEWVLIKDFGTQKPQGIAADASLKPKPTKPDYIYDWDLKAIDTKNESYYNNRLQGNTGEYKVYVKYKDKPNQNKYQEKFKTFYLSENLKNQASIITSFDMGNGMWNGWYNQNKNLLLNLENEISASNNKNKTQLNFNKNILDFIKNPIEEVVKYSIYPTVANQNCPFLIFTDTENSGGDYVVSIKGDNGYNEIPKDISWTVGRNLWLWVPKDSGIFNIVVKNNTTEITTTRKVYVNSWNDQYLQLENLATWTEESGETSVGAKIATGRPTGFNTDEDKAMKFVISEPYVWSKTIKNYGQHVEKSSAGDYSGYYYINENTEEFEFKSGYYGVAAYIKGKNSIEFEDGIAKDVDLRDETLKKLMSNIKITANPNVEPTSTFEKHQRFTFTIEVDENEIPKGVELEYSFLVWDARGKKMIQKYSREKTFAWKPADSGEYVVYGRVRQVTDETDKLPNSYEKEMAIPVKIIDDEVSNVTITKAKIDNKEIGNKGNPSIINKSVANHQMHYIDITAKYSDEKLLNEVASQEDSKGKDKDKDKCPPVVTPTTIKDRLMYKAYATHDGVFMALNDYSPNNILPFYPKSKGEYKILVLVKDSLSGSEEVREEYIINVN